MKNKNRRCCRRVINVISGRLNSSNFKFSEFSFQLVCCDCHLLLRMGDSDGSADDVDIFRNTPIRYLGYTNEVGEAFRGVIPNRLVTASYGVASLYVMADAGTKAAHAWKTQDEQLRNKEAIKHGVDVLIWQTFASILIPGLTINRICAVSRHFLVRSPLCQVAKPLTVAIGLSSIPFIIQPIDKAVDYAMDEIVRPYLKRL